MGLEVCRKMCSEVCRKKNVSRGLQKKCVQGDTLFEKQCCPFFSVVLDGILFILTGNEEDTLNNDDIHKSLDEFEIRPDQTTDHRVSCP